MHVLLGRVKRARIFFVAILLALVASLGGAEGMSRFPFALDLLGDAALIGGGVALYGGSPPAPIPEAEARQDRGGSGRDSLLRSGLSIPALGGAGHRGG